MRTLERRIPAWKAAFTLASGPLPLSIWRVPYHHAALPHCQKAKSLAPCPAKGGGELSVHCGCGSPMKICEPWVCRVPISKIVQVTPLPCNSALCRTALLGLYTWLARKITPMERGGCKNAATLLFNMRNLLTEQKPQPL